MKKQLDTRKALIAVAVIVLSLGALVWQVAEYQRKQAEFQAALQAANTDPMLNLQWRNATEKERKAALSSIKNQLDAFKRNDSNAATKYQSKSLRQNFADAKSFMLIIKKGYPQFANYKSVIFGSEQIDKSGKYFRVPVTVTGIDGLKADALYTMIFEEGLWRVSGVQGGSTRRNTAPQKSDSNLKA